MDVLVRNAIDGKVYSNTVITLHEGKSTDIYLSLTADGWYTVNHIVIPTKTWFDKELAKTTASSIGLYDIVYYTDGDRLYKYNNGSTSEVLAEELA